MTRAGEEITSRLLTIPEAAHYLRASTNFVRTLLWKHDLKFVKCGKKFCIDRADLDRWIEKSKRLA